MATFVRELRTCCSCQMLLRSSLKRLRQTPASLINYDSRNYSSEPLSSPTDRKSYPDHIVSIVDSISKLNLLEVSSLNELLKAKLNIQDAPMMPMAGFAVPVDDTEPDEPPEEAQTEFAVKILKFDDSKKVKLIKEIKAVLTDFNLVQAKKFVESAPQLVKEKLSKEDADKLKVQLEAVGATVEIE